MFPIGLKKEKKLLSHQIGNLLKSPNKNRVVYQIRTSKC